MLVIAQTGRTGAYASEADFEACRALHRAHGATYYFATLRFPPRFRRPVHALYGFVRVPDELVDRPGNSGPEEVRDALLSYRKDLCRGFEGVRSDDPVLRAFCDVCKACDLGLEEPLLFLDAMEADISVNR